MKNTFNIIKPIKKITYFKLEHIYTRSIPNILLLRKMHLHCLDL